MNYNQTLAYLYAQLPMYHRIGAQAYKANLDNTMKFSEILNHPHEAFQSVHVAGTNGKGSVCHTLASIFQEAGYRTGLYSSPHLIDFRERIRVNGRKISTSYVTGFVKKYMEHTESIRPSFFEWTVALAFDYFRHQQVDIAIIETGLGGRLDSTNIIHPLVSVITNISYDHCQLLGDTLEQIAGEKAGIIKPGVPVVIGESQPETSGLFTNAAIENQSEIIFADRVYTVVNQWLTGRNNAKRVMDINRGGVFYLSGIQLPLTGTCQLKNVLTTLAVIDQIKLHGFQLGPDVIRAGIRNVVKNTGLMGRWQLIRKRPLTFCDTAHNEGGIREVLLNAEQTPHKMIRFVFGVVNDKDIDGILSLLPASAVYYFCCPGVPRGLDAEILQGRAFKAGLKGDVYPSVMDALHAAWDEAAPEDLVIVGGSTFVVADVLKFIEKSDQ